MTSSEDLRASSMMKICKNKSGWMESNSESLLMFPVKLHGNPSLQTSHQHFSSTSYDRFSFPKIIQNVHTRVAACAHRVFSNGVKKTFNQSKVDFRFPLCISMIRTIFSSSWCFLPIVCRNLTWRTVSCFAIKSGALFLRGNEGKAVVSGHRTVKRRQKDIIVVTILCAPSKSRTL